LEENIRRYIMFGPNRSQEMPLCSFFLPFLFLPFLFFLSFPQIPLFLILSSYLRHPILAQIVILGLMAIFMSVVGRLFNKFCQCCKPRPPSAKYFSTVQKRKRERERGKRAREQERKRERE